MKVKFKGKALNETPLHSFQSHLLHMNICSLLLGPAQRSRTKWIGNEKDKLR